MIICFSNHCSKGPLPTCYFPPFRRSTDRERSVAAADAVAAAAAAAAAASGSSAAAAAAAAAAGTSSGGGASGSDRESIFRWRDRQYFGPKRWLESALRDSAWQDKDDDSAPNKKRDQALSQSPLWLGDDLEFWPDIVKSGAPLKFAKIAALHSELVAVSDRGHLYQWRWCDLTPFRGDNPTGNHPR